MVKELREMTSAPMMDCKKALDASNGNLSEAVDFLRRKGIAREINESRSTDEGLIEAYCSPSCEARIVELNCETDFVARNQKFKNLAWQVATGVGLYEDDVKAASAILGENIVIRRIATLDFDYVFKYVHSNGRIGVLVAVDQHKPDLATDIAMHIAAAGSKYLSREDVPAELVEKERAFLLTQPDLASKPEAVRPKMIEGRMRKFYEQMCLLEQPFVKDPSMTVGQLLKNNQVAVLGFVRFELGGK
jgi:elongation factor Ts